VDTETARRMGLVVSPTAAIDPETGESFDDPAKDLYEARQALGGRKFETYDMTPALVKRAEDYLAQAGGAYQVEQGSFLDSMVQWNIVQEKALTLGQAKGIANWASAAYARTLKQATKNDGPNQPEWYANVPESRYALGTEPEVRFYRVNKPKKGKWEGWTFIDRIVGSPGDFRKVVTSRQEREAAMAEIAADPQAAGKRFADKAGVCARCMAALTDPESRQRGYGPDCWEYIGGS
jgi:hypothetical protein